AILVIGVGIHARERTDTPRRGPSARAFAVGYGDALAALDDRQHLPAGNKNRIECLHTLPARCADALRPGPPRPRRARSRLTKRRYSVISPRYEAKSAPTPASAGAGILRAKALIILESP